MRLHRLRITGFGPFAGTEDIDLEALSSSGLFLIHGPTGAGKTSILDAVCFALYAAVPGARAGARASLRSDHAPEGVVPEVTLELTAGGRRFRVRRSPEFLRVKQRGSGTTKVQARVVLQELVSGEWVARGTRHDEAGLLLKDVLGMGLEQFIKVVLLPQGDFAAFLQATPEERRAVLERLFDTQRFTDIETWLAERRKVTGDRLRSSRDHLCTGLVRVDDVLARLDEGDDLVAPSWAAVPPDQVGAVLAGLVDAVDSRASTAMAAVEVARTRLAISEAALHDGRRVAERQHTAARARARLAALDEQQEVYDDGVRAVALAERAAAVRGFLVAAEDCRRALAAAQSNVLLLRQPVAAIVPPDAGVGRVRSLADQLGDHSAALQQVAALAARATALADESARHDTDSAHHEATLAKIVKQRADRETRRAAAEKACEAGRTAAAELPARQARHKNLARIRLLLGEQERSTAQLATLERQADVATGTLLDARERVIDLRERRLAGIAAELADGLSEGAPCPVCGSCAHPTIATSTDPVNADDILLAETAQSAAADVVSEARAQVAAELARRDERALELATQSPALSAAEVPGALAGAQAAIDEGQVAASALGEAERTVERLTQGLERLRARAETSSSAMASSRALATSARAQSLSAVDEVARLLAVHADTCPCRPSADPVVGQVVTHHRQTLLGLQSLATARHELETQDANAAEAAARLSTSLQDNGFESEQDAQAAAMAPEAAAELTRLLRATEQQRAEANALLAQTDVLAAIDLPAPDLEALAVTHVAAAADLTDAGRRHTLSEQAQRDLRALSCTVAAALESLGPAAAEARLVASLADCVNGTGLDNERRMRLSSYVLAARLREVATFANERLAAMSDGRYALEYTDALAARGARSGLGLLVRDAWTGQSRETSSLSGGESFMASLALALGLGDAVRAEAGGFDLQTLFVDEGFGTLDEDSLEQVMAVLDGLREGGRAVGVVSHVSELRQRIPAQLEVQKQQAGSRIRTGSGSPPPPDS